MSFALTNALIKNLHYMESTFEAKCCNIFIAAVTIASFWKWDKKQLLSWHCMQGRFPVFLTFSFPNWTIYSQLCSGWRSFFQLCACFMRFVILKLAIDPDVIWTRNLLIWSQTRYRCAMAPCWQLRACVHFTVLVGLPDGLAKCHCLLMILGGQSLPLLVLVTGRVV